VNPGSRYLGIAVFHGLTLVDWRVRVLKGSWSAHKLEKGTQTIRSFIQRYHPEALAIKQLHPARCSNNVILLAGCIRSLFEQQGLSVFQFSIKQVEKNFLPDVPLNRRELAAAMAAHYPDLTSELQKETAAKNPYHLRMFEAVALGALGAHKLDKL
jgi:Holliday junction resolvasome RuvABC endonuclease subunit